MAEILERINAKYFFKMVMNELKNVFKEGAEKIKINEDQLDKLIEELKNKIKIVDDKIKSYKDKGVPTRYKDFRESLNNVKEHLENIKEAEDPTEHIKALKNDLVKLSKLTGKEKLTVFGVYSTFFLILTGILTAIIVPSLKHKTKKK